MFIISLNLQDASVAQALSPYYTGGNGLRKVKSLAQLEDGTVII